MADKARDRGVCEAGGVAETTEIGNHPAKDVQKYASIRAVEVYRAPGVSTGHYMVYSPGALDCRGLAIIWQSTW